MCGVYGIFTRGVLNDSKLKKVQSIDAILKHRGPDGRGFWHKDNVALGHRRLSILDETDSGVQPMHYKNGRYTIAYNGEIYNFIELRDELIKKGYVFNSNTDTEVVIAAYDCWGEKCLDKFNGMWAFSLWDSKENILLLSRDRFGVKPLYYLEQGNDFIFASEVKGIHYWLGKKARTNDRILAQISSGSRLHHGTNETHLENVYSLPAGHNIIIRKGKLSIYKWYALKSVDVPDNLQGQADEFKKIFTDACNLRLRSDVSIASCLSGGLDSSSIVSTIHKKLSVKNNERRSSDYHKAFTMSFKGAYTDEGASAKSLANELGFGFNAIEMTEPSIDGLELALGAMDGPMPNLAFYPIYELYSSIKKNNIKVTLDGMGPDEMLGGYYPLGDALKASFENRNPSWAFDVFKTYRNKGENQFYSAKREANSILYHLLLDTAASLVKNKSLEFGKSSIDYSASTPNGLDSFQGHLFNSFFQNTLPMLLNQYESCSMANSIESRMPFLDYRLVEYSFSLPNASKVGGGFTKRILREAMKGVVPQRILKDKLKLGFHPPQIEWFNNSNSMREWMMEIVADKTFTESTIFDADKIKYDIVNYNKDSVKDIRKNNYIEGLYGPICTTWWINNIFNK